MLPKSILFASSVPLRCSHPIHNSIKSAPVCVLGERRTGKVDPGRKAEAHVVPKRNVTSRFYTVLPPDLPKEMLPNPPPIHWSVPMIGFLVEHWLNLGSPEQRAKKYGGIYSSSFLLGPMHFVADMEASVDIQKDPETFSSAESWAAAKAMFGPEAMLLLDGADHIAARNMVAPAFAPGLFPFYFHIIRERVERTWTKVQNDVKTGGHAKLDPALREHYLCIVVEMTTGIDMDSDEASYIREQFLLLSNAFFSPPLGPIWNRGMQAKKDISKILNDLIRRTLVEKKDAIDKLREYGENLSRMGSKDIAEGDVNILLIALARSTLKPGYNQENDPAIIESLTNLMLLLWFAGFATSAATSACASLEMGMDSNIWDQLTDEQDQIVRKEGNKEVTYDQVKGKMPLLNSFINEMLRTHPATGGVLRVATKDVEILGKLVKAGERIFLDFKAAMRDPRMYEDPDLIKVDRFIKKPGEATAPRVIAFGGPGSPHYCLGAALAMVLMKTTFAVLLREYKLELDPNQSRNYALVPDDMPKSKVVVQTMERR